ncbi:MAG TPA: type II toxin-antitoxin system Phd/YefM family antitoxin [Anaerolineales bacterium]|nr:type II toxin-antitoxin system Phd/YefM family antitoxin [Anaerolineales bacterium]
MTILIGARDIRQRFAEILGKVGFGGDIAVVERSGKPMAALIPIEMYEQMIAEREARFQIVEKIRAVQANFTPEEIERDVAQAIKKVRKQNAARRP